jgi:hypothetical protein
MSMYIVDDGQGGASEKKWRRCMGFEPTVPTFR